ncbi:MAG: hypothetical protein JEY99_17565 [Spirochaetales bacterium]|nr:hypothetical protein [Spirochaetales bacterium]
MVYKAIDLSNPYFWLFLAALFLGVGAGRLPFLYGKNHLRRSLGSRGLIFVSILFSFSVFAVVAALFATAGGLFTDQPVDLSFLMGRTWIPLVSAGFVMGGLFCRFPRSVGIPLLIISSGIMIFSFQAFKSWSCYEPGEEILTVKIIAEQDVSVVKFTFPPDGELISTIEGKGVIPVVERINCSPVFFFLGNGRLYRINGLILSEPAGGNIPFLLPSLSGKVWGDALVYAAERIPALEYEVLHPDPPSPRLNETFNLFFDNENELLYQSVSPF